MILSLFTVPSTQIRKIKNTIDNLYLEKQKIEKGDKPKKAKGGKVKARLRVEGDNVSLILRSYKRKLLLILFSSSTG